MKRAPDMYDFQNDLFAKESVLAVYLRRWVNGVLRGIVLWK